MAAQPSAPIFTVRRESFVPAAGPGALVTPLRPADGATDASLATVNRQAILSAWGDDDRVLTYLLDR